MSVDLKPATDLPFWLHRLGLMESRGQLESVGAVEIAEYRQTLAGRKARGWVTDCPDCPDLHLFPSGCPVRRARLSAADELTEPQEVTR